MTLKSFVQTVCNPKNKILLGVSIYWGDYPIGSVSNDISFSSSKDKYTMEFIVQGTKYAQNLGRALTLSGQGTIDVGLSSLSNLGLILSLPKSTDELVTTFSMRNRKFYLHGFSVPVGELKEKVNVQLLFAEKKSDSKSVFENLVGSSLNKSETERIISLVNRFGLTGWYLSNYSYAKSDDGVNVAVDLNGSNADKYSTIGINSGLLTIVSQTATILLDRYTIRVYKDYEGIHFDLGKKGNILLSKNIGQDFI